MICQRYINFEKALLLQETAESIMRRNEFDVSSPQVMALINEGNCSSYDCKFIALAHHLNIPLVTQDEKILKEFPSTAITVAGFLSRYSGKP